MTMIPGQRLISPRVTTMRLVGLVVKLEPRGTEDYNSVMWKKFMIKLTKEEGREERYQAGK